MSIRLLPEPKKTPLWSTLVDEYLTDHAGMSSPRITAEDCGRILERLARLSATALHARDSAARAESLDGMLNYAHGCQAKAEEAQIILAFIRHWRVDPDLHEPMLEACDRLTECIALAYKHTRQLWIEKTTRDAGL